MFSNIRWNIALWFLSLSAAAYIIPTTLALIIFHISLTAAIDRELDGFIASFGHAINVVDGHPTLRDWARMVQTNPAHSFISYQLFDRDAHLLESHFPPGIPMLFKHESEVSSGKVTMRTRMTELLEKQNIVGYLQVQLPTKSRDDAERKLALITMIAAPLVLLGLSWSSYLVSEKATVKIRQNLETLRKFIADASHELYTPLSIVQAAHESIAQIDSIRNQASAELEISESALGRLEKMIEDLTLLSKMESVTSKEVDREIISLNLSLEDIVNEFRPKFEQKFIKLSLIADKEIKILGDYEATQRMFANIIENAWRYTNPQGSVAIHLTREGRMARIIISDTGIGIPKEELPNIFNRFYRVDVSRSRLSGGTGLGLAIALAIVQTHRGTIEAKSDIGEGSVFTISLPIEDSLNT